MTPEQRRRVREEIDRATVVRPPEQPPESLDEELARVLTEATAKAAHRRTR